MAGPTTQSPYRPASLKPGGNVAEHAAMRRRAKEPQSGGDRYGIAKPKPSGKLPQSRGHAQETPGTGTIDHHGEDHHTHKYPAFSNAQRLKDGGTWGSHPHGNSVGRAEMLTDYHDGHVTDTIKRYADNRLRRTFEANDDVKNENKAQGREFSAQPFRRESRAFGPLHDHHATHEQDHNEHEHKPPFGNHFVHRRLEGGSQKSKIRSTV